MKRSLLVIALCALASAGVRADQGACDKILQANQKTGGAGATMKTTGYAFARDTPGIYGSGTHTCSHVRDEVVDGQAAEVYREQYQSKTGSTDALIWISKSTGRVLREEQDGDVTGKGKGHITYVWGPGGADRAASSDVPACPKLERHPRVCDRERRPDGARDGRLGDDSGRLVQEQRLQVLHAFDGVPGRQVRLPRRQHHDLRPRGQDPDRIRPDDFAIGTEMARLR
jgi:hypothetical protein